MGSQSAPAQRQPGPLGVAAALVFSFVTGAVAGAEPPTQPILRIETTMHSALVRRLAVDPAATV